MHLCLQVSKLDSGDYKCVIKNEAGQIIKSVPVKVDGECSYATDVLISQNCFVRNSR